MSACERRCICRHAEKTHVFDGGESICAFEGCHCREFHLWEVTFVDPFGNLHTVHDIAKFVRDNPDKFTEDERRPRMTNHQGQHGLARFMVYAEIGFSRLITGKAVCWHGWTLATLPKTFRP